MKPVRNFLYYNNCTGGVVVNNDDTLIEEYALKGDILYLTISLKSNKKEIIFSKINKPFYSLPFP